MSKYPRIKALGTGLAEAFRINRKTAEEANRILRERDALEAERDRLAEHNRVLAAEVNLAREWNKLRNAPRGSGVLSDWQRRLSRRRAATDASGALARAGQEGGGA